MHTFVNVYFYCAHTDLQVFFLVKVTFFKKKLEHICISIIQYRIFFVKQFIVYKSVHIGTGV